MKAPPGMKGIDKAAGRAAVRNGSGRSVRMAICAFLAASAWPAGGEAVRYEDFGAKGDGAADDLPAIAAAHRSANERGLPVRARDGAVYYIGGKDLTAEIRTDTDFGKARFTIDDRDVENPGAPVFRAAPASPRIRPGGIRALAAGQKRIPAAFPGPCLVTAWNRERLQFIRFGANANRGAPQNDTFLVDGRGNVDPRTPIVWDFPKLTDIGARPLEKGTLTISGGVFTTIANDNKGKKRYFSRGLDIRRSNVLIRGTAHLVSGEGDEGFPYGGFIRVADCACVTIRDCVFTGHKTYSVRKAGRAVPQGTYDFAAMRAARVSLINCRQSDDITDRSRWGVMVSNFCKDLLLDGCVFSRFDAHQGVANATVRNCVLGHSGCNAIGFGTLLLENTTVKGPSLVNFRSDYGSFWDGDVVVRNCTYDAPGGRRPVVLFSGKNAGTHDFGYVCRLPGTIRIEGLLVKDAGRGKTYRGPAVLGDFNPAYRRPDYKERHPYIKPETVFVKDLKTESGKKWRLTDNPVMFRAVRVVEKWAPEAGSRESSTAAGGRQTDKEKRGITHNRE